jgi:hypothetical protein
LDAAEAPFDVVPCKGRDGSDTFQLVEAGGRRAWFGQSSMPTVSTHEVLAGFSGDGGSVSLPGILTGLEPLVLAERLPGHCAVFVIEDEPFQLKLAMCLYDYADLISTGRLVFLFADRLEGELRRLFTFHPGYGLPTSLVRVPHRSAASLTELQRRLEHAGEAASGVIAEAVESTVQALGRRSHGALPKTLRVAVLGTDARWLSLEHAGRIDRALSKLAWPHTLCVPDAPDKCHVVARLMAVDRSSADWALMVNSCAGQLQALLPSGLPIASWYLPGADVGATLAAGPMPEHIVFASSRTLERQLAAAGVSPSLIEPAAPAADVAAFGTVRLSPEESARWSADVAVLMDLPDDRPEACHITLDSHVALWRALSEAVGREPDRYRDEVAEEFLKAAERASGTTLRDDSTRGQFLMLLKACLAPARTVRAAVDTLIGDGQRVAVWGAGWSRVYGDATVARGAIPGGGDLIRMFHAARVLVFPVPSPWAIQLAVDALAAGSEAALRTTREAFCGEYPGLAELAPHIRFYRTGQDLAGSVQSAKGRVACGSQVAAGPSGREVVLTRHTLSHRLQTMAGRMRGRRAASVATD